VSVKKGQSILVQKQACRIRANDCLYKTVEKDGARRCDNRVRPFEKRKEGFERDKAHLQRFTPVRRGLSRDDCPGSPRAGAKLKLHQWCATLCLGKPTVKRRHLAADVSPQARLYLERGDAVRSSLTTRTVLVLLLLYVPFD
jgi:hypothetical protein